MEARPGTGSGWLLRAGQPTRRGARRTMSATRLRCASVTGVSSIRRTFSSPSNGISHATRSASLCASLGSSGSGTGTGKRHLALNAQCPCQSFPGAHGGVRGSRGDSRRDAQGVRPPVGTKAGPGGGNAGKGPGSTWQPATAGHGARQRPTARTAWSLPRSVVDPPQRVTTVWFPGRDLVTTLSMSHLIDIYVVIILV